MSDMKSEAGSGPFGGLSILEIADRIRKRKITALEVTEQALTAAHENGTKLNCFVTIDDEGALRAARLADRELDSGLDRGPLHGIPVGVKDVIATSGLATTMGSRHFANHVPMVDADVVISLRRSGAVILGKTQSHEFAYGPTGDRTATGPVRNPHDNSRMSGGSSAGSGAAVAAGIVPIALGTDTGGSVRIPAALCGAVGLRPTQGALSARGVFPLSPSMDTVGPMGGSVLDTAIAWWALSSRPGTNGVGGLEWNERFIPRPERAKNLRFARVTSDLLRRTASELINSAETVLEELSRSGAHVATLPVPEIDACWDPYVAIQSAEAFAIHSKRVDDSPELFDSEVLERLRIAAEVKGWTYVQALEKRRLLRVATLERTFSSDILVMPTVPIEAPAIGQRRLPPDSGWANPREALLSMTAPWSVLGFPAISIPVFSPCTDMPHSIQLVGKPGHETQLLDAAALLEVRLREKALTGA
ncbi:amidase [Cryobacterium serini]|nr:amidase [Cryobacterium serini]